MRFRTTFVVVPLTTFILLEPFSLVAQDVVSGRFYHMEIVGEPTATVADRFWINGPSINNQGDVVFGGRLDTPTIQRLFVTPAGTTTPTVKAQGAVAVASYTHCDVNATDQVASLEIQVNTLLEDIKLFDAGGSTLIARGSGIDFTKVMPDVSLNDSGQIAFVGRTPAGIEQLVTGVRPNFNTADLPGLTSTLNARRPMIANTGQVVLRIGKNASDLIRLYDYSLASWQDIATTTANPGTIPALFEVLGRSPGISADGEVVVFYGQPNQAGTVALALLSHLR